MADPGDEAVFSTETAARPEDETETLRRQVDTLFTENRDLRRIVYENGLYIKDVEEKNQEYSKTITTQASRLHENDALIARLKDRSVNFEAELEGLHLTTEESRATISELRAELAAVKDAANDGHQMVETLRPMLQDYLSENLQHIDALYDNRVLRDDAQVELRALEGDLRAAAMDHNHMDAILTTLDNVVADHARLRGRLDIVEEHFPGTLVMEAPELNNFLTDFRREQGAPPSGRKSADSRGSEKSRGSRGPKGLHVGRRRGGKDGRRSVSLADELEGHADAVGEETEEADEVEEETKEADAVEAETEKAVLTTPSTALAPGGFPQSPLRPAAATGSTDHTGARSGDPSDPETAVFALPHNVTWWHALPAIAIALLFFVAGYWWGDYQWSNANGYAHHSQYFHVTRGLLKFFLDAVGGVMLWLLGFFCDPMRVFESWAQLTYSDTTRPG